MQLIIRFTIILLTNYFFSAVSLATACKIEDFKTYVSSNIGCIGIEQAKQKSNSNPDKLVIYLHGDSGNRKISGKLLKAASDSGNTKTLSFLMARPGWQTPSGYVSFGGDPIRVDNGDNYIPKRDIDPVAHAIKSLKDYYQPEKVIVVGFSGGAAVTGIILGRFPDLIDIAVLSACPCIVPPWREHRMQQKIGVKPSGKIWWPNSHSPHDYVSDIDKQTKVILVLGIDDSNTKLEYSEKYHHMVEEQGIYTELHIIDGAGHVNMRTNNDYINLLTTIQKDY